MLSLNKLIMSVSVFLFTFAGAYSECDWFFIDDTLYWETCGKGLMFGTESNLFRINGSSTVDNTKHKIKNVHRKADFGFRLGLGYTHPCECWETSICWTNFVNNAHGHHTGRNSLSAWFTPALGIHPPVEDSVETTACAHWKLRLNLVDFDLALHRQYTSHLCLKPILGIRVASLDQNYDVKYVTDSTRQTFTKVTCITDFKGAGLRFGLEAEYYLGCGYSLYGSSAGALLWGQQEVKNKEKVRIVNLNSQEFIKFEQRDHESGCLAIADLAIGISWQYCCWNHLIDMKFGYEQHWFFNQQKFEKFVNFDESDILFATDRYPQVSRGDLCIHGLILSSVIEF